MATMKMFSVLISTLKIFRRATNVTFAAVKWQFGPDYIDDVFPFLYTPKEYIQSIEKVLNLVQETATTLKLKKPNFFLDAVNRIEVVIAPGILDMAIKTNDTVSTLKYVTTLTLWSFVRPYNAHKRFVPNFTRKDALLNQLLRSVL